MLASGSSDPRTPRAPSPYACWRRSDPQTPRARARRAGARRSRTGAGRTPGPRPGATSPQAATMSAHSLRSPPGHWCHQLASAPFGHLARQRLDPQRPTVGGDMRVADRPALAGDSVRQVPGAGERQLPGAGEDPEVARLGKAGARPRRASPLHPTRPGPPHAARCRGRRDGHLSEHPARLLGREKQVLREPERA